MSALLARAFAKVGETGVAARLGLHPNTVRRWRGRGSAPAAYAPDLQRLLGLPIQGSPDAYFTTPETAGRCFDIFTDAITEMGLKPEECEYIEPSAGNGVFLDLLPVERRLGMDLSPGRAGIIRADFLTWRPARPGRYCVVGNPPFGLRGHAALQFINHAATFAEAVGFILPPLFASDGKGAPGKRVKGLRLLRSANLRDAPFVKGGRTATVNTIFQVYGGRPRPRRPRPSCDEFVSIHSISDGGTPASTRNRRLIGKCDLYLPSTTYAGMAAYRHFDDLPQRRGYGIIIHQAKRAIRAMLLNHDWRATAFPSTNSALNLRRSLIVDVVLAAGYRDSRTDHALL